MLKHNTCCGSCTIIDVRSKVNFDLSILVRLENVAPKNTYTHSTKLRLLEMSCRKYLTQLTGRKLNLSRLQDRHMNHKAIAATCR